MTADLVSEKAEWAKVFQKMNILFLENPLGPLEGVRGPKSLGCTFKFSIRRRKEQLLCNRQRKRITSPLTSTLLLDDGEEGRMRLMETVWFNELTGDLAPPPRGELMTTQLIYVEWM